MAWPLHPQLVTDGRGRHGYTTRYSDGIIAARAMTFCGSGAAIKAVRQSMRLEGGRGGERGNKSGNGQASAEEVAEQGEACNGIKTTILDDRALNL